MKRIPSASIDMILCDLPYGMTDCSWDEIIPIEPLWEEYNRVIKANCAIALFGSQPFSSLLVMSNRKMFRHEWVWEKPQGTNFLLAKKRPMKVHEDVLVFSQIPPRYFPQMTTGDPYVAKNRKQYISEVYRHVVKKSVVNTGTRYPRSVIKMKREVGLHPTQKPVALFEYFIKTYTVENDLVLDNCAGSGTTAIACLKTKRNFILIEKEPKYVETIRKRIQDFKSFHK
jgi:site-specific DNA-methyltransferase (adenine-specific)